MDNCGKYDAVFINALALCNNAYDDKKRNRKCKMDCDFVNNAVGGRFYNMHFVFKYSEVIYIKTGRKFFRPVSYFYFARYSLFF